LSELSIACGLHWLYFRSPKMPLKQQLELERTEPRRPRRLETTRSSLIDQGVKMDHSVQSIYRTVNFWFRLPTRVEIDQMNFLEP